MTEVQNAIFPLFIGSTLMSSVTDDWSITVMCMKCYHMHVIGRLSSFSKARKIKTTGEFRARLKCSRCGTRMPEVKATYVGPRR